MLKLSWIIQSSRLNALIDRFLLSLPGGSERYPRVYIESENLMTFPDPVVMCEEESCLMPSRF